MKYLFYFFLTIIYPSLCNAQLVIESKKGVTPSSKFLMLENDRTNNTDFLEDFSELQNNVIQKENFGSNNFLSQAKNSTSAYYYNKNVNTGIRISMEIAGRTLENSIVGKFTPSFILALSTTAYEEALNRVHESNETANFNSLSKSLAVIYSENRPLFVDISESEQVKLAAEYLEKTFLSSELDPNAQEALQDMFYKESLSFFKKLSQNDTKIENLISNVQNENAIARYVLQQELNTFFNKVSKDLNDNRADILKSADEIKRINKQVNINTNNIKSNKLQIEKNENSIIANRLDIDKNRRLIYSNQLRISENSSRITNLEGQVNAINGQLSEINNKLDDVLFNQQLIYSGLLTIDSVLNEALFEIKQANININKSRIESLEYYKSLNSQLEFIQNYLSNNFERINWKQDVLISATRALYTKEYSTCHNLLNSTIENYDDLIINYTAINISSSCLNGLDELLASDHDFIYLMSSYLTPTLTNNKSEAEKEIEFYELSYNYWIQSKSLLFDSLDYIILNNPFIQLNGEATARYNLRSLDTIPSLINTSSMIPSKYLNYEAIRQISTRFIDLYPYFEFGKNSEFRPLALNKDFPADVKYKRLINHKRYLNRLLELTNTSINQQSILTGTTIVNKAYSSLFFEGKKSNNELELLIKLLNGNPYFNINFQKRIISDVLNNDKINLSILNDQITSLGLDSVVIEELSLLINRTNNQLSLHIDKVDTNQLLLLIELPQYESDTLPKSILDVDIVKKEGNKYFLRLKLNNSSITNYNKQYTGQLFELIETKENIKTKLKEIDFTLLTLEIDDDELDQLLNYELAKLLNN